jgi:hypothetical protein
MRRSSEWLFCARARDPGVFEAVVDGFEVSSAE